MRVWLWMLCYLFIIAYCRSNEEGLCVLRSASFYYEHELYQLTLRARITTSSSFSEYGGKCSLFSQLRCWLWPPQPHLAFRSLFVIWLLFLHAVICGWMNSVMRWTPHQWEHQNTYFTYICLYLCIPLYMSRYTISFYFYSMMWCVTWESPAPRAWWRCPCGATTYRYSVYLWFRLRWIKKLVS